MLRNIKTRMRRAIQSFQCKIEHILDIMINIFIKILKMHEKTRILIK